jgi:protease I
VLSGRRITGWRSVAQDIRNAGAEYIDGNLVSSRQPDDIPAFIEASLTKLEEAGAGRPKTAVAGQR